MAQTEQRKSYHVTKDFKGINTKANRTAIDQNEFAWLENVMPIGYGNLRVIPTFGNALATTAAAPKTMTSANINGINYMFFFQSNGGCQAMNLASNALTTVAAAATFSSSGVQIAQWNNERVLIIDPVNGYFNWNGTNLVKMGSLLGITITNGGSGYTSAPIVTFSAPNQTGGVQAAVSPLSATAITISSGKITNITPTEAGSGYTSAPTVYIGTAGASAWAATTVYKTGVLLSSGGNYYYVTIGGTSGSTSPSHTSGSASNGTTTLLYIANPDGSGSSATATTSLLSLTGQAIATFSGRSWIALGRTVYYSAVNSYNDFGTVSAGSITINDGTLHGDITQLVSANNFLYVFGTDSINVFSDVRVNASTGGTLFTNTNVSASIGSDLSAAIFAYFRSVLFMNRYGVYALVGATTTKISDALDNIFPNIDFTYPVTACQTLIYNILVAAWSVTYNDKGTLRKIQLVFFDRKWFVSDMGELTHVASSPVNGLITAYGARANGSVYKLYSNTSSSITSVCKTALWALNDPIRTKQALKLGVEVTFPTTVVGLVNITMDSESNSATAVSLGNAVNWQNLFLSNIPFTNNSNVQVAWVSSGYQLTEGYNLLKYDAQMYGKYLGMSITSTAPAFTYNGFQLEHEPRVRF